MGEYLTLNSWKNSFQNVQINNEPAKGGNNKTLRRVKSTHDVAGTNLFCLLNLLKFESI